MTPVGRFCRVIEREVVLQHEKVAADRMDGVCAPRGSLLGRSWLRQFDTAYHADSAEPIDEGREQRRLGWPSGRLCDWRSAGR